MHQNIEKKIAALLNNWGEGPSGLNSFRQVTEVKISIE